MPDTEYTDILSVRVRETAQTVQAGLRALSNAFAALQLREEDGVTVIPPGAVLNFGLTETASLVRPLRLYNVGNEVLIYGGMIVTGVGFGVQFEPPIGTPVPIGGFISVVVVFIPPFEREIAEQIFPGTLSIASNDPASPYSILLVASKAAVGARDYALASVSMESALYQPIVVQQNQSEKALAAVAMDSAAYVSVLFTRNEQGKGLASVAMESASYSLVIVATTEDERALASVSMESASYEHILNTENRSEKALASVAMESAAYIHV